jgi:hypothetical protein
MVEIRDKEIREKYWMSIDFLLNRILDKPSDINKLGT